MGRMLRTEPIFSVSLRKLCKTYLSLLEVETYFGVCLYRFTKGKVSLTNLSACCILAMSSFLYTEL